ncbi:transglutaminase-like domain-containing protein [Vibrio parahaemolyticus]|uniref:Transglutaminase-like domain-containing protein n=1 Tax=Vibrio parahaemolyticus TaxID=670 RepID=A0AAW8Q9S1_VIBPH|nr:transglutaminase-like domain-containing protein [Vibrio parahaemolyticus]MBE3701077.1 transglutaminase domain-containing protein [Vibrio parahaemolyticus]MBE3780315.1 transglutaminase domain-containing protein [Vibrio parahaemolyticus]MCZ6023637.1 transglutaminase-like domain-containing protein [Vibrio parahaemolyticus]MCZ6249923.1 transglutaminase-like domain-containing protein [Vibrio parahaemolyticus]MDS1824449.1 transglutaminase-like domain-containing protein [Vibrio parahaemolyticus]
MTRSELVQEVLYMAENITQNFKPVDGSCLYMSAMLVAMMNDHLPVETRFVTGSLSVAESKIFALQPIKPILSQKEGVIGKWDGHAWVEVDDLIIDLSLFRTVFSKAASPRIHSLFEARFERGTAYLVGQKHKLLEMGVVYTPLELLSDDDATIFIQNAGRMGLINS